MQVSEARLDRGSERIGRLRVAIHQHRALSPKGIQERVFSRLFSGLVYPQIWEDPVVDLEALQLESTSRVVAIASGGCNVMSYLSASPAQIHALDLNTAHVALTRLKITAALHLPDHATFHQFFAGADDAANISAYDRYLRPKLDPVTRAFWDGRGITGRRRIGMFSRNIYRHGLLGRFIGAAHLLARAYGITFEELVDAADQSKQRVFFDERLAPLFERRFVRWLTSNPASLFGLGIPPAQFHALSGGRPMHEVLRERLERLACDFPVNENYFAQQAFGRAYVPGATLPPYLDPANFAHVREAARRVDVAHMSFTEFLKSRVAGSLDRYVLLDAQDWMTDTQLT